MGLGGKPRLIDRGTACAVADGIRAGWREEPDADIDSDTVIARLLGGSEHSGPTAPSEDNAAARVMAAIRGFRRSGQTFGTKGLWPGQNIATAAPVNATLLNVSQFPIWRPHYLSWLRYRPDIRAVFFLHDLLPLEYPEFFRAFEVHRHAGRLAAIARHAAGVIVASESTKSSFHRYMRVRDLKAPPVLVAPLPVSPLFASSELRLGAPDMIPSRRYFLTIGTLEPRKNHLFLLQVWRELTERMGKATPKLILVGIRGWDNENVLDMLERCAALKETVVEAPHLSTPALRQLMARCEAVLMPSFAEGYGLPVAEALATGTPVIASDIEVFRSVPSSLVHRVDPLDGPGWLDAISARLAAKRTGDHGAYSSSRTDASCYFRHAESFLDGLV